MESLVSIIIPVYNVKDYLQKCINSILRQTYQNLEIIIVNDGSTDGSALLCDKLAEADQRITVIHKENGGLVSARKVGIRLAKGKYILNIDSDDWIDENMVEQLLKLALTNDADIVTSGYYEESEDNTIVRVDSLPEGNYNTEMERCFLYQHLISNGGEMGVNVALWCKLVRTAMMQQIYLQMSETIRVGEDTAFVYSCLALAERITISHDKYYHYAVRKGSISRSINKYYFREMNEVVLFIEENFNKNKYKEELKKQLDYHTVVLCLRGIEKYFGIGNEFVIPRYGFPQNALPADSKLIIYGAGAVGKSYYKKIRLDNLYKLVCWIDKNYLEYQKQDMEVYSPATIDEKDYDYILLALRDEHLAEQVKDELKGNYHIDEKRILWFKPIDLIAECMDNG